MVDGAFTTTTTNQALEDLADTVHIAGRQQEGSRRTRRRRYRTGMENGSATSNAATGCADRLSRATKATIWDGWATLTYNAATHTTLK